MSGEPVPGSLEDILGVWDAQGPFPLRDKGDVALLVDEIKRLRAELDLLEELVEDAVAQGCSDGDRFDSCAISTWADGIRWLAARGVLVIESDHGRRVIARRAAHPVEADR